MKKVIDWNDESTLFKLMVRFPINIKKVKTPSEELCVYAVYHDGLVLEYIKNQTDKIIWTAVKNNYNSIIFADDKLVTHDMVKYILKQCSNDGNYDICEYFNLRKFPDLYYEYLKLLLKNI